MTTSPFSFIALVAAAVFVGTSITTAIICIALAVVIELIISIGTQVDDV